MSDKILLIEEKEINKKIGIQRKFDNFELTLLCQ